MEKKELKRKLTASVPSDVGKHIKLTPKNDNDMLVNIPKDCDIDESKLAPFDEILPNLALEFKNLNISTICQLFKPILDEFYELSYAYRYDKPTYNNCLEQFIAELCSIYNIERTVMIVYANKYTTNDWGRVYWLFLHYASILLNYAYEMGKITHFLNFPLIVYNIDTILPCPKCILHYKSIKNDFAVKNTIKQMAFGSNINGLIRFHNIITENVDKTPEYMHKPKRLMFSQAHFAAQYRCIERHNELLQKSLLYEPIHIDWQPTTHTLLTIILMTYCPQSYSRTSNNLKKNLYSNHNAFETNNLNIKYTSYLIFSSEEHMLNSLTPKQIKYCLMRAILLQFQDTTLKSDDIKNLTVFHEAISKLYTMHPEFVRKLVKLNLLDDGDEKIKNYILNMINGLKVVATSIND